MVWWYEPLHSAELTMVVLLSSLHSTIYLTLPLSNSTLFYGEALAIWDMAMVQYLRGSYYFVNNLR